MKIEFEELSTSAFQELSDKLQRQRGQPLIDVGKLPGFCQLYSDESGQTAKALIAINTGSPFLERLNDLASKKGINPWKIGPLAVGVHEYTRALGGNELIACAREFEEVVSWARSLRQDPRRMLVIYGKAAQISKESHPDVKEAFREVMSGLLTRRR